MEEKICKIPDWLRYILSIPFGLIYAFVVGVIIYASNTFFASQDSLWVLIINFIFLNGGNVMLFFWGLNIMLPKNEFIITLVLSILIGIAYTILQGMAIVLNILTFEYILAYILFTISLIFSTYLSYKGIFKN